MHFIDPSFFYPIKILLKVEDCDWDGEKNLDCNLQVCHASHKLLNRTKLLHWAYYPFVHFS